MPDALANIVGPRTGTGFGRIAANDFAPLYYINIGSLAYDTALEKRPAATKYKKQVDTIKNICIEAKFPPLQSHEVSNEAAAGNAQDDGKRERARRKTQAYSADEDHRFQALTKYRDEGENEHGILLAPQLEAAFRAFAFSAVLGFDGSGELDTPLILKLGDPEQGSSHDGDDNRGKQPEAPLPDIFGVGPVVMA
ncbi:MAG: hypothetical protein Q9191_001562 [Dirinaria sp. TL-2023a]